MTPWTPQSDALAEWIATLPGQAFILVFVAHVLQAGLGAFVAAAMAKSRTPAVVVIVLSVLGVVNFINLWEVTPLWMLLEFPVYFLLGGVGLRAGLRIRGAAPHGQQAGRSSVRLRIGPKFVLPLGQKLKGFPRRQSVQIGVADLLHDGVLFRC